MHHDHQCEKEPKRLSSIPYFLHTCALPVQVLLLHFLCKAGSEGTHEEQPRKKKDADETFRGVLQCRCFLKSRMISEINATQQYLCLTFLLSPTVCFVHIYCIYTCGNLGLYGTYCTVFTIFRPRCGMPGPWSSERSTLAGALPDW